MLKRLADLVPRGMEADGSGRTRPVPAGSWASSRAVRQSMLGNRGRDTLPELRIRRLLWRAGLRYLVDVRPARGLPRVDILIRGPRVAVLVHGCFWHGCPEHGHYPRTNAAYWAAKVESNVDRDRRAEDSLARAGWSVVRVWEHEDPGEAAAMIVAQWDGRVGRGPAGRPCRRRSQWPGCGRPG